ncbi:MAG: hypothetical protein V7K41_24445 [Nostoc sp.]|uniref:hypothetical protein n=1 Tax=Nostoc sp. TaxID=1180 RepID=UPI002FF5C2A5
MLFFNNALAIGTVYLIYRYIELLEEPIQQFGRQVQDLQEAEAALIRVRELLTTQSCLPDIGQTTLPDQALSVSFENVDFRYPTPEKDAIAYGKFNFSTPASAIISLCLSHLSPINA